MTPQREFYRVRKSVRVHERMVRGLCVDCGEPAPGYRRCEACRKRNVQEVLRSRERRALNKALAPQPNSEESKP